MSFWRTATTPAHSRAHRRHGSPGDTLIADGNRRYRVTAVIPLPRLEEFVDGARNGVLEVEPFVANLKQ
jgi:hypothetical protein